jgi:hypothetical protein
MKNLKALLILFVIFTSCEKVDDDTNDICTSDCTTFRGKFVSLNDEPVPNIKVTLKYRISGGELGGGSTRKIVDTRSDQQGIFNKNFFIKDSELGEAPPGYFRGEIDDSKLDVNKYIRTDNLIGGNSVDIGFAIFSILSRDTIIDETYYIPKKAYIKVNLNNFVPVQADDYFEVQTLYPFGRKVGVNTFLDSEYSTGFSGYGNWKAQNLNNTLNVFVAEGEKNIVRIFRRKNGINTSEDFPIIVPANNTIELTYTY